MMPPSSSPTSLSAASVAQCSPPTSSSPAASSSAISWVSESSTLVYDHEPFDSFRHRVAKLAVSVFWPGADTKDIVVERLHGGGFNRVIGIAHQPSSSRYKYLHRTKTLLNKMHFRTWLRGVFTGKPEQVCHLKLSKAVHDAQGIHFVLRVPRFEPDGSLTESSDVGDQAAVLGLVRQQSTIPVARVLAFDQTDQNALGQCYMVQERLSGVSLWGFQSLSHDQKCRIARELGGIFKQILSIRNSTPGRIFSAETSDLIEKRRIFVNPLGFKEDDGSVDCPPADKDNITAEQHLIAGFAAFTLPTANAQFSDKFCRMASELAAKGFLSDRDYSLCHLDLAPGNILFSPQAKAQQPIITGILDWDSAIFAPSFMACTPPMWIWAWDNDKDEDELLANDVPAKSEDQELKALFEEAAGAEYMRFAYAAEYRLARRLVRFAFDGMHYSHQWTEAEEMLREWRDLSLGKDEQ